MERDVSALRLLPFLDGFDAGAAVFDGDGRLVYLNPAGARLAGRRCADVVGTVAPTLPGVVERPWLDGHAAALVVTGPGGEAYENTIHRASGHHLVLFRAIGGNRGHAAAVASACEHLAAALTPAEVVDRAGRSIGAAVGAGRVELAILGPDHVTRIEARDGQVREHQLDRTARIPLVDAAHRGELWLDTPEALADRYPDLASERVAAAERAWVYLPLRGASGSMGALGLSFSATGGVSPGERNAIRAIARHVALATERAILVGGLRDALRITDEVIGILGHDLRNPIHAIILTIETLLGEHENEPLARFLVRMRNSAERMARLIDQLLDLAKARLGGGVEVQPVRMDLGALVQQHIDELQPGAVQVLELEIRGDTTGEWDPDRLSQVLGNLLGNAVRHGDHDAPIQVEVDGSSPDELLLSVWNGGAIPGELLPVVFEPFRGSQDRKKGGLGLGLYIAKQVIEAHRGTLSVRSSLLSGTTFVVALPRLSAPS